MNKTLVICYKFLYHAKVFINTRQETRIKLFIFRRRIKERCN